MSSLHSILYQLNTRVITLPNLRACVCVRCSLPSRQNVVRLMMSPIELEWVHSEPRTRKTCLWAGEERWSVDYVQRVCDGVCSFVTLVTQAQCHEGRGLLLNALYPFRGGYKNCVNRWLWYAWTTKINSENKEDGERNKNFAYSVGTSNKWTPNYKYQ